MRRERVTTVGRRGEWSRWWARRAWHRHRRGAGGGGAGGRVAAASAVGREHTHAPSRALKFLEGATPEAAREGGTPLTPLLLFAVWLVAVLMLETDSLLLFAGILLFREGVGGKLMVPCSTAAGPPSSSSAPPAAPRYAASHGR